MRKTKKQKELIGSIVSFAGLMLAIYIFSTTGSFGKGIGAWFGVMVAYLVYTMYENIKYRKLLRMSGIAEVDLMDGIQFEHFLRELFERLGYEVKLTKESGDFGADLILKKDSAKIAVQAKRYKKAVGIKAVQEISASVKVYNADTAWVVTNSTYTKAASDLAKANHVKLIDRDQLVQMINASKRQQTKQLEKAAN